MEKSHLRVRPKPCSKLHICRLSTRHPDGGHQTNVGLLPASIHCQPVSQLIQQQMYYHRHMQISGQGIFSLSLIRGGGGLPTEEEKTFCLMSAAQGVDSSSSISVPLEKMPNAWGGRGIGQLHCLVWARRELQRVDDKGYAESQQ